MGGRHERASAWLLAILFCLTCLCSGQFLLLFSASRTLRPSPLAVPLEVFHGTETIEQQPAGSISSPEDLTNDPSIEPVQALETEMTSILNQVSQVRTDVLVAEPASARQGEGANAGASDGSGNFLRSRKTDPRRWIFTIESASTPTAYARLLSQLGLELGAFDDTSFCYLSQTPNGPRVRRVSSGRDERFYTVWQQGDLVDLDRQLFARAGIGKLKSAVLHFFDPATEANLVRLEREAAKHAGQRVSRVRRTHFGVRKAASETFEFFVLHQHYR